MSEICVLVIVNVSLLYNSEPIYHNCLSMTVNAPQFCPTMRQSLTCFSVATYVSELSLGISQLSPILKGRLWSEISHLGK